jgi:hypothetical protein
MGVARDDGLDPPGHCARHHGQVVAIPDRHLDVDRWQQRCEKDESLANVLLAQPVASELGAAQRLDDLLRQLPRRDGVDGRRP